MRELTIHDLGAELAEQLPTRELMGSTCGCHSGVTYNQGSYDGNFDGNGGLIGIAVANGSLTETTSISDRLIATALRGRDP